nr:hypothetical protein [Sphingomonas bacterium]
MIVDQETSAEILANIGDGEDVGVEGRADENAVGGSFSGLRFQRKAVFPRETLRDDRRARVATAGPGFAQGDGEPHGGGGAAPRRGVHVGADETAHVRGPRVSDEVRAIRESLIGLARLAPRKRRRSPPAKGRRVARRRLR